MPETRLQSIDEIGSQNIGEETKNMFTPLGHACNKNSEYFISSISVIKSFFMYVTKLFSDEKEKNPVYKSKLKNRVKTSEITPTNS